MTLFRLLLASAVSAALAGCHEGAAPAVPALAFEARPVPPEGSAIYPVTLAPGAALAGGGRSVTVRGGFFLGRPGYELEARLDRTSPAASRLTVRAVRGQRYGVSASHFDYEATVALPPGGELTVVHVVDGAASADTVFRGRPL
jgi:hypothetical protein